MSSLRVLHLSDIHFSTKHDDERIVHSDVRDQLLTDLKILVARGGKIDTVLIAGDVAFSGKRDEYKDAATWLEQVTDICGCPKTAVLLVPGNHDIDRKRVNATTKLLHRRLRSCSLPEAMAELVELANHKDGSLTEKLSDYQEFASSYGCHFPSPASPSWKRSFPIGSTQRVLRFVGLTSVQVCDGEDAKGALLLGRHQYVIDEQPAVEQLVVMHHPFEWLKDRKEAESYLLQRARVLIFGHEHYQEIHKTVDANNIERLVISSGALTPEHAAEPYIYRYNVLEFSVLEENDCPRLDVTVFPEVWVPEQTRFQADTNRLGGRDSTTFRLRCPQFKLLPSDTSPAPTPAFGPDNTMTSPPDDNFSRLAYLFWRHLDWRQRLKIIVEADILPTTEAPHFPSMDHLALERAKAEDKLGHIWDRIMRVFPKHKREASPFPRRTP